MFAQNKLSVKDDKSSELDFTSISIESIDKELEFIKNQFSFEYYFLTTTQSVH